MSGLGTMALEYGERIDFARLRRERLARCLAEMEREGLDALLLGQEANARYVSGARRLWTVGMRPFGPGCVVVHADRSVHLLSTWDEGIPAEIPRENLFQTTWDPQKLMAQLQRVPGLDEARRVGIDGMSPHFAGLLPAALPKAELVDALPALLRARAAKTRDEVECIRTAVAIAEGALAAIAPEIRPGTPERRLVGRYAQEAARLGVTIPALEGTFCATPTSPANGHPPLRQLSSSRPLAHGDLVACHAGVMYAGYEGGLARTFRCPAGSAPTRGDRDLSSRIEALLGALRAACRPGASVAELRRAYEDSGEPLPQLPIVHGVGLGFEPPVAGLSGDPGHATLEPGMVIAIQAYVWTEGLGGCLARETWWLGPQGPERLDRLHHGPR